MSSNTGPNLSLFERVYRRQIYDNIFVDSSPTQNRTPRRVRRLCPIQFEPVRLGPGKKTWSTRFKMLAFVWDKFQPIPTRRLGDKPCQHYGAQAVREPACDLKIRPKPWPNDEETSWNFWSDF